MPAKNKMSDLRDHLFETLEALRDNESPMDIDRALAVSAVAGTLIDSVKAEIRFMEASGELAASEFFGDPNGGGQRASRMLR